MAGYVGYKVSGVAGAAAGLIGVAVPTIIAMIALGVVYSALSRQPAHHRFFEGGAPRRDCTFGTGRLRVRAERFWAAPAVAQQLGLLAAGYRRLYLGGSL